MPYLRDFQTGDTDARHWEELRRQRNWIMPRTARWQRLWGVRHVWAVWRMYKHIRSVAKGVTKPSPYVYWMCHGIWMGKE
jgi:hypothetical protein